MLRRTSKIEIQLFHQKQIKKIRKWKKYLKKRNNRRNNQKVEKDISRYSDHKKKRFLEKSSFCLRLPSDFRLFSNPNGVISFINKIEQIAIKHPQIVKFELNDVSDIDIGAICLFLSKLNELSIRKIRTWGNLPKKTDCADYIRESGFLDKMKDMTSGKNFFRKSDNLIVNRGFDRTDNETLGKVIQKAVSYLTGVEESYRPLFTISQEICANSIEHANFVKNKKNWLYSISRDKESISFTMIDIGEGTLKTIQRKFFDKIRDFGNNDIDILLNAFLGKYQSRTGDSNRNKGLPKIYQTSLNGYIEDLVVITNNVFLDFNSFDSSKILNENLKGTFYYWKINKNNIEKWKQRLN